MSLGAALYVAVTPEVVQAMDKSWGGKEPRHDMRFAVVREWYVPADDWRQHYSRHPLSYHGYHGLDVYHWRYPRANQEYIMLWCESHDDVEHADQTIGDIQRLLDETVGAGSYQVLRQEYRDQELR